jgi:hypothetical protein
VPRDAEGEALEAQRRELEAELHRLDGVAKAALLSRGR